MSAAAVMVSTVRRGASAHRRHDYHYISRWSPDDALWDLGRFFFDVAGLAEVRLY
jgi:hypothetical protein